MSATQSTSAGNARERSNVLPSHGAIAHGNLSKPEAANAEVREYQTGPKRAGYGMPCAQCKTYYAANLAACPVCKATERVAPTIALKTNSAVNDERSPDPAALEAEREAFLREFNSQAYAASLQLGPSAAAHCTREENHHGEMQAATVCQECYDQLQERVDVLEAVLHMDVKEAAEVIYEAVWSDPSDPSKTYLNAAQAMLGELKKRSGITQVFGLLQPLPH